MTTRKPYLTLAETCRKLGVSRKALRLYESQGLVTPERTASEWRVYGPDQIERLYQVLALKRFGFPLNRVAEMLSGKAADMASLLALHEQVVKRELDTLQRAASLLSAARSKLARDGSLSTDDLISLTKETTMNERKAHLEDLYEQIAGKHLSADDQQTLSRNGFTSMLQPDTDWDRLHEEGRRLMDIGDAGSAEAMDFAKRWMSKVFEATGGDPELTRKVRDVAQDLLEDQAFQNASSATNAMMVFVQKAYGCAIDAGLMPRP